MSFSEAPYFGGKHVQQWRDHAAIAEKIRSYLGLGIYISVYAIEFEVWEKVIWVWVPGFRPQFISRKALGV